MATAIPENECAFTLNEVVDATVAEVHGGTARAFSGVTTDTRANLRGKLFIALQGERFDGHRFVEDAVRAGATGVLVQRDVTLPASASVLRVASTLEALGALARAHRLRWGGKLIAIAGAAGKTTTKQAVSAALAAHAPGAVHKTPGNLNNRIGVPMVLFGLTPQHRFAVVEIGTNVCGEVGMLAGMCRPDIGILTRIAHEHSEGLGDLDSIEAEEGSLLAALENEATALVNADDFRCKRQLARSGATNKLTYGMDDGASYRVADRQLTRSGRSRVTIVRAAERVSVETNLLGAAGALALAAAFAAAERALDATLGPAELARAFLAPELNEPGRLQLVELADGTAVLDDTYNANPASVESSLLAARELARVRQARLVLVIGEMRELGSYSPALHGEVGEQIAGSGASALIAVAGDALHFVAPARARGMQASFAEDSEHALEQALRTVRAGDVVLVKASRGVRTERVVQGLLAARGRAA